MTNLEHNELVACMPHAKPKLLVLASTYPRWHGDHEPGFIHELCRRMLRDFSVTVLTSHVDGAASEENMDGVEVVRYSYAPRFLETLVYGGGIAANLRRSKWKYLLVPTFFLMQYLHARRVARRQGIDIIHAHWLIPQGVVASRLRSSLGIPFVVTSHGGDLFGLRGRWLAKLKRAVATDAAAVTVVSGAMLEEIERLGLSAESVQVIPMGVDIKERFTPALEQPRMPDELLFVGRLVPKKGLVYLIDALALVVRERVHCRLTIAGFGPEEGAVRQKVTEHGLTEKVAFLGPVIQQDLPELYRRAAVLVAPFVRDTSGNQEGLPVVLMEAIACGCPAVVGRVAGIADLLGAEDSLYCVDPRNIRQLADAIIRVLDNPDEAQAWTQSIREKMLDQLDWDVVAARYSSLLASVCKSRVGT